MTRETHRRSTLEIPPDVLCDALDVSRVVQKAQAFRKGNFTHHVKGEPLQPHAQIAYLAPTREQLVEAVEENAHGGIDVALKRHEIAHRVDGRNRFLERAVQIFVLRREDRRRWFALGVEEKHMIEIGLVRYQNTDCNQKLRKK